MRLKETIVAFFNINKKGCWGFRWLYRVRKRDNKITNLILYKKENQIVTIYLYNGSDYNGNWSLTYSLLEELVKGKNIIRSSELDELPKFLSKAIEEMGMIQRNVI